MINCCVATDDLCINQGATYQRTWVWVVNPCGCSGTAGAQPQPKDLTGYTATMQIRAFALSTTLLYDASADIVLGGQEGTITLTIDAEDTEGFDWWNAVYDLILTGPSGSIAIGFTADSSITADSSLTADSSTSPTMVVPGFVTRFLQGSVTVSPGVTMPSVGTQVLNDAGVGVQNDAGQQVNTSN